MTQSKSQVAYHWLKERIATQEYTPGYRLVLASLARDLDMSVVPVREALRQLEAEGLVTFERNIGAHVSMVDDTQYRYAMETVSVLEGAATALSARRLSAHDLRAARDVNEQMIASLEDFNPKRFTELNREFHAILFSRCTNPRLVTLVEAEWVRLGQLRTSTFAFVPGRARESVGEHENICRLIEIGAPLGEIEKVARHHRAATLDAYLMHEHPDDTLGLPVI